jgi:hypothetical protein
LLKSTFDDQRQERIRIETEAVVIILERLSRKEWTWLGSQVLKIEIDCMPDAVHLACAESGGADIFLSTDDRLIKRAMRFSKKLKVKIMNPLDWLRETI